jgi:hypothetical protein
VSDGNKRVSVWRNHGRPQFALNSAAFEILEPVDLLSCCHINQGKSPEVIVAIIYGNREIAVAAVTWQH